ncbi:MAG: carbohydrate-binding domain-containing protein [Anaerolineae bacterium]|nr:carbohydrate-binding domain-containing protein [Anaerolineae bacterium]
MIPHKLFAVLAAASLLTLVACSPQQPAPSASSGGVATVASPAVTQPTAAASAAATRVATAASAAATRVATAVSPAATQPTAAATIVFGDTISINGAGAVTTADGVKITAGGTYTLSGILKDGMVEVDAPGAVVDLILAGVTISNADGPAIYLARATDATVTLKTGTSNTVSDGGSSDLDAAIYARMPLTFRGDGNLQVNGNAHEGISSTMHITVEGGNIRVKALEDGINANNDGVSVITISGGYLLVETTVGDGIDSNGKIVITGGTVITHGSITDVNAGLDADSGVTITGGTVIATGSSMLNKPTAASTVKSLLVAFNGTQRAGTLVSIQAGSSAPILVFAPSLDFQRLLYASSQVAEGVTYTVSTGGTASGAPVDGLYPAGPVSGASQVGTVTTATIPAGGRPGGRP